MEKQIEYLNRDTLNSNPALSEKSLEPYKMNKDQILVKTLQNLYKQKLKIITNSNLNVVSLCHPVLKMFHAVRDF